MVDGLLESNNTIGSESNWEKADVRKDRVSLTSFVGYQPSFHHAHPPSRIGEFPIDLLPSCWAVGNTASFMPVSRAPVMYKGPLRPPYEQGQLIAHTQQF